MFRTTAALLMLLPFTQVFAGEVNLSEVVEVEISIIEGFNVIGMDYRGSNPEEVMALWEEFVQRIEEIPGVEMDDDGYGVLTGHDVISDEFSYLACVESDMTDPLPAGMVKLSIPGGEYAILTFPFVLLNQIYDFAYGEWLPESAYTRGDGYDFEYYPADFIPSEEGVLMQLFVSIK